MSSLGKVRQSDFPRYDSTKNKPAWPDYARDVFSFLSGVGGGKPLAGVLKDFMGLRQEAAVDNPMAPTWMKPGEEQHALFKGLDEVGTDEVVRPPTRPSKNLDDDDDDEERTLVTPDGVRVKIPPRIPEEDERSMASTQGGGERQTLAEVLADPTVSRLDQDLYGVFRSAISGTLKTRCDCVTRQSFVMAFCAVHKAVEPSTCKHKSFVLRGLRELKYNQDPHEYDARARESIAAVYSSGVTIEDVIMDSVLHSFDDELTRRDISKKIDAGDLTKETIYDELSRLTGVLLMAQPDEAPSRKGARVRPKRPAAGAERTGAGKPGDDVVCDRCRRRGHKKRDCFAKTDVDGKQLRGDPPAQPPQGGRDQGGRGKDAPRQDRGGKGGGDRDALKKMQALLPGTRQPAEKEGRRRQAKPSRRRRGRSRGKGDLYKEEWDLSNPTPEQLDEIERVALTFIDNSDRETAKEAALLVGQVRGLKQAATQPPPAPRTALLDSGAGVHADPDPEDVDPNDRTEVEAFDGKTTWSGGLGHKVFRMTATKDGKTVPIDLDEVDKLPVPSPILSLGKLVRDGWGFVADGTDPDKIVVELTRRYRRERRPHGGRRVRSRPRSEGAPSNQPETRRSSPRCPTVGPSRAAEEATRQGCPRRTTRSYRRVPAPTSRPGHRPGRRPRPDLGGATTTTWTTRQATEAGQAHPLQGGAARDRPRAETRGPRTDGSLVNQPSSCSAVWLDQAHPAE